MPASTVAEMMLAYAQDAVDYAREQHQVHLDYSGESIEQVEEILGLLHRSQPHGLLARLRQRASSLANTRRLSLMFGGYIGEVVRRQWGGHWDTASRVSAEAVLTLHVRGNDMFPANKVYKRLTQGDEDNVWHYYQVVRHLLTEQQP